MFAIQIIRKGIVMLDFLLWNKIARIIKQLADTLHISTDRALQIFYDLMFVVCYMTKN